MKCLVVFFVFTTLSSPIFGFKIDAIFDADLRKMLSNAYPECPVAPTEGCPEQIEYWFYNNVNRDGTKLDITNLGNAGFKDKPLKVLIHGYQNDHTSQMIQVLKDGYLDNGEYNILVVDWGYFTKAGCYYQAFHSINPVGGCAAGVFGDLIREQRFPNIHILGHSLGAHVASRFSGHFSNIDRLTRFDPASPGFFKVATDEGKAKFRDTYHSNSDILGQENALTDIDVYLNSGTFQPGCGCDLACSHMRSVLYFVESIKNGMWGFYCSSWDKFLNGDCKPPTKETVRRLGDNADTNERKASFTVFGRPTAPFLYKEEDYYDPRTYEQMKNDAQPACQEQVEERLKELVSKYMKGLSDTVQ